MPAEVALRLFELFLVYKDVKSAILMETVIKSLTLQMDKIMQLDDDGELFRYVSHGYFLTDSFMDEALFNQLF